MIPPPGGAENWALNDRIRREGTRNLLAAVEHAGARRYVQQSITLLYRDHDGQVVDEWTPLQPAPLIQSAADRDDSLQVGRFASCRDSAGLRAAYRDRQSEAESSGFTWHALGPHPPAVRLDQSLANVEAETKPCDASAACLAGSEEAGE